jgi:CTP synthase
MRLGTYDCELMEGTQSILAYGKSEIQERHRHRFELNNELRDTLKENGLKIAGINPERDLVEIIEIESHPWFVGVQFHPELKSTVGEPHPLFTAFVKASLKLKRKLGTEKSVTEQNQPV